MDVLHGAINKLTGKKPELPEKTEQSEQDYADAEAEEEEESNEQYFASARKERDYQVTEEDMSVNTGAFSKDTVGVWDRKVFNRPEISRAPLAKTILSSMATSNYPTADSYQAHLSVAMNRLIYGQIDIILRLADKYEKNKDRYYTESEFVLTENPFDEHASLLLTKLDAANKSYLSTDMIGLKEMNTQTKHIKRAEQGLADNMTRR